VDVLIHIFLTSALAGVDRSASLPGRSIPDTHWIGGWVDPKAGVDNVEKRKFLTLPALELVQPLASRYTDYNQQYFIQEDAV
jgi:hypothetical protein